MAPPVIVNSGALILCLGDGQSSVAIALPRIRTRARRFWTFCDGAHAAKIDIPGKEISWDLREVGDEWRVHPLTCPVGAHP